ncbi:hypothetical protein [Actinokineospora terrae]|uniref:Uncharacterized protein n=1 Tax=Actinokineospora terrae TaxID=155974 RepID=A0A1H9XRJ4_9PSEU|nr:hypothetical protein [Actinokineospora terrae]SES48751.1 hypothetical protein SAMN04487818_1222 [Actinokineospora terrae]
MRNAPPTADPTPEPEPGHGPRAKEWREIIDGWVTKDSIRRDAIITAAIILTILITGIATAANALPLGAITHWLTTTLPGWITSGGVLTASGATLHHRRKHRHLPTNTPTPPADTTPPPDTHNSGDDPVQP